MNSIGTALAAILILTLIVQRTVADIETAPDSADDSQHLPDGRYESDVEDSLPAEEEMSNGPIFFNKLQRRDWCARLGDFCVADTKLKFAECCKGLRCSCGTLWQSGKCQCKMASILGRR